MALTQEQIEFINYIGGLAAADMRKSKILASLTTAQAILESGWGKSGLAVKGKALFGIKAGTNWTGKIYTAETNEYVDGRKVTITDAFRAYDTWVDSIADHSRLLCSLERYSAVVGECDYIAACRAIQAAGYATDPNYANELIRIIEQYGLTRFDEVLSMTAIDKVIAVAEGEIGYLEKKTNSQLDDKTANAGTANYTKYWRDIKPEYQGQPWCGCFVTWCFVQAFGKEKTVQLLRHYPYVYCPAMQQYFTLNENPKRGDIVVFKRNGEFTHTGIVTGVEGDYFTTIEGNTSGGSAIIANGGGVFKKGYYNSNLPGTKFVTVDWNLVEAGRDTDVSLLAHATGEEIDMAKIEELESKIEKIKNGYDGIITAMGAEIKELKEKTNPFIYNYMDDNMPDWAKPTIQKMMDKGILKGDEEGRLGLTYELLRLFVTNDRAGVYDLR